MPSDRPKENIDTGYSEPYRETGDPLDVSNRLSGAAASIERRRQEIASRVQTPTASPVSSTSEDTPALTPPAALGLTVEQFVQLLGALRDSSRAGTDAIAEAIGKTARGASNPHPPMISCFNPRGERDHPRPELKCPMYFGPYEFDIMLLDLEEIELLNKLVPGEYVIRKSDESQVLLTVNAQRNRVTGRPERMDIMFPADEDSRHNYPSLKVMLREAIRQATERAEQAEQAERADQAQAVL